MRYKILKKITPRKQGAGPFRFLITLIAVPVVIIAMISFGVWLIILFVAGHAFAAVKSFQKKKTVLPPKPFYIELDLLHNVHIKILAVEDETDTELGWLNEIWSEEAYHEQTYLYRAKTSPLVPAIEGKIICFYLKELPDNVILQIVSDQNPNKQLLTTQLICLQYSNLEVFPIEEIGLFHLYNDDVDRDVIKGFNRQEEIKIYLDSM